MDGLTMFRIPHSAFVSPQRHRQGESTPMPDGAHDVNASPEQLSETARNEETQTRSAEAAGEAGLELREWLKETHDVLTSDSDAGVGNIEDHPVTGV